MTEVETQNQTNMFTNYCIINHEPENTELNYEQLEDFGRRNHIEKYGIGAYCHLCRKTLSSLKHINEHLQGYRHNKAQKSLDSARRNKPNLNEASVKSEVDKTELESLECEENDSLSSNIKIVENGLNSLNFEERQNCFRESLYDCEKLGEPLFEHICKKEDNTFFCSLCEAVLLNSIVVEQHLAGKRHLRCKNLRLYPSVEWDRVYELQHGEKGFIIQTAPKRYKCILCSRKLDPKNVIPHVVGYEHQTALGHKSTTKDVKLSLFTLQETWNEIFTAEGGRWSNICHVSADDFRCVPCEKLLSIKNVIDHVNDLSHQKLIRSPTVLQKNETLQTIFDNLWKNMDVAKRTHMIHFIIESEVSLYCIACNTRVPLTRDNISRHICGKHHMETIIRNLIDSPRRSLTNNEVRKSKLDDQEALVSALMPKESKVDNCQNTKTVKASQEFHCLICVVRVTSDEAWNQHNCSDEHRRKVDKLQDEERDLITGSCRVCDATIFCIDGEIDKHDCIMILDKNSEPDCSGKSDDSEVEMDCDSVTRIVLTGYPKGCGMETLYSYFKSYGKISFVAVNSESAIIEFEESDAVEKALGEPQFIGQKKIIVNAINNYKKIEQEQQFYMNKEIVSIFQSVHTFEAKIEELCKMACPVMNVENTKTVCQFLESALASTFEGCKAYPFGSRVSGLAFSDSDLDIYFDTGDMYNGTQKQEPDAQEYIVSVVQHKLEEFPECRNVESIPKARTPIVRFLHFPTNIKCDVAFRHGLGVENTKLLRFYLSLDPRIKPLILFLKLWTQLHELSGPACITNYALSWLAIFYLQQASGFGLPSVEVLRNVYKGTEKKIADWDCGVCTDQKILKTKIKSSKSVLQLLHGFFEHYENFNFSKYVVCPLVGVPVKKYTFSKKLEYLPQSMENYMTYVSEKKQAEKLKVQTCMCVQDPLDLSHNVTKGVSGSVLRKFKKTCQLTKDCIKKIVD